MEDVPLVNQDTKELPQLFQSVVAKGIDGFDSVEEIGCVDRCTSSTYSTAAAKVTECTPFQDEDDASQTTALHQVHAISISMPLPQLGPRRVLFSDEAEPMDCKEKASAHAISFEMPKRTKSYQPKSYVDTAVNGKYLEPMQLQMKNPRSQRLKNNQFASFKTFSGTFERQRSHFLGKQWDVEAEADASANTGVEPLPVGRYFDALEGPELDTLRGSEELVLPEDRKWPFLLRYPITSFGICLGTSSQSILWKTIATSKSTRFLHVNVDVNLILWCISVAIASMVFFTYSLKVIFYFEAVRREYYHPIRINFFFAPWIALLFLALGIPPSIVKDLPPYLWYILMTPILCLELKLYGQWMSGGSRRLSKVANPTNHLAVVGNFVGALLGASMGLKEGPIFFFAVGMAHYTVLFVTLYQRLPTNETLPKELHPVFFLFVAAPSVASMAWARIQGKFDYGSRIPYFIAMFLYCSLAVRVNFFRGFKFSLSWWAYTFPMTGAAIATIRYSNEVKNPITQALAVLLSAISTLAVTSLLISTMIHAFVMHDLFPNDIAIAIAHTNVKDTEPVHQRSAPSDAKATDQSLEATNSVEQ